MVLVHISFEVEFCPLLADIEFKTNIFGHGSGKLAQLALQEFAQRVPG